MRRLALSTQRLLTTLALSGLLAACGGGGSSDAPGSDVPPPVVPPPTTPTDPVPVAPTAAFTAAATAAVQAPVAFDASTSKAADGSALLYVWDFGDGVRGGGAKIAHAFGAAGTRSVTLTVIDAGGRQGKVTKGVEVTPAAAAVGTVVVHAAIVDDAGAAVSGVVVGKPGSATPLGTTDASGQVDVTLDRGPVLVLRLTKAGYADQTQTIQLPATAGVDTRITAVMRPRDAAQTLADAHAGGSLTGRLGATITLPADALVNAAGTLVTGAVPISMTTVDPTLAGGGGFPGRFDGVTPDGATTPIVSFGTVEFVLGDDANRLQLAPGKTATIELPVMANRKLDGSAVAVGDVIPLWSLDETTGVWIQEGTGTIVANAGATSGLAMRAVVSHFSWWNTDIGFDPYGPNPDCKPDNGLGIPEATDFFNNATVCNMLAEIDRTLSGTTAALRLRPAAATPTNAIIAGYARRVVVPVNGGTVIPVPANNNVKLTATALNGTWSGTKVVNGPFNQTDVVTVPMRPVQAVGPTAEVITLPVTNLARSITAAQPGRFSFTAAELQYAHFQISGAAGTTVNGTVRVLQGSTVLGTSAFSNTTANNLVVGLSTAGSYILEISVDQTAGVLITGELLGGVTNEAVGFPADVTRSVPQYATYRAGFDLSAAATVHFAAVTNTGVPKGELRLTGPDGSVLFTRSNVDGTAQLFELALPAGHYAFTYGRTDVAATTIRFTSEVTDWLPLGDPLPVDDIYSVVELVADRNGRPVVGVIRHPVANQTYTSTLQLRRLNGAAWEDVGPTITTSPLSCGNHTSSFAFDSTNTPTIAYTSRSATDVYTASVRRLVGGVWTAVGPNDGVLPASQEGCDDSRGARLVIDAADRPIGAYHGDSKILIERFDGTAWNKLAVTAQDSFPVIFSAHDIALDPAGTLWFALRGDNSLGDVTVVRRFDVPSGTWVIVGPNGGVLPEANTNGFAQLRLKFDASGRPVVGGTIGVLDATRTSSSTGTAVYRFDGTSWSTTGGYQLPGSYVNNTQIPGFAMLGNDALMTWTNQYGSNNAAGVVQRNTASGWSGFGAGVDGKLAAYTAHAATPSRAFYDGHLLVVGSDVYLAVEVPSKPDNVAGALPTVQLLKKTP
ncbi:hypothetical protein BH10PSE17_BH10PSE17_12470 [soil metagenome]